MVRNLAPEFIKRHPIDLLNAICPGSPTEADFHQASRPPMSQQSLLTTRACLLSTKPQVPSNSLSDALVLEDDQSTQMTRQRLPTRAKLTSCSSEEALYHDFRQHQVHKQHGSRQQDWVAETCVD
jgi:hypothetical protein